MAHSATRKPSLFFENKHISRLVIYQIVSLHPYLFQLRAQTGYCPPLSSGGRITRHSQCWDLPGKQQGHTHDCLQRWGKVSTLGFFQWNRHCPDFFTFWLGLDHSWMPYVNHRLEKCLISFAIWRPWGVTLLLPWNGVGTAKSCYVGLRLCGSHLQGSVPRQQPQGLLFAPFVEADLCGNGKCWMLLQRRERDPSVMEGAGGKNLTLQQVNN